MKRKGIVTLTAAMLSLAALVAAQGKDKYALKVPGGLAFSEFKGYESWQTIAVSKNEKAMAVILGNPAMIAAYQSGIPGNGKPFPDGARMAKIHWAPKQSSYPGIRPCPTRNGTWTSW